MIIGRTGSSNEAEGFRHSSGSAVFATLSEFGQKLGSNNVKRSAETSELLGLWSRVSGSRVYGFRFWAFGLQATGQCVMDVGDFLNVGVRFFTCYQV